jgi:predicted RNA-binding Zn-ribbon protein involved in translation (DUF1610 family)
MGVYICGKCGIAIVSNSYPQGTPCPKGGMHQWYRVCKDCSTAPNGYSKAYQCKKCGIVVYTNNEIPQGTPCPAGGMHWWFKIS